MEELIQCKKKIEKLNSILEDITQRSDGWFAHINKQLEEALYLSERLTLDMRKMYNLDYSATFDQSRERFLEVTREAVEVTVEVKSSDEIYITMPEICTKKKYSDRYLRDTLSEALSKTFKTPLMLKDRVVVFKYIYQNIEDNQFNGESDYDNIETRSVINALTKFILFDDAPQYYQVFYCTEKGEKTMTTVSILTQERFKASIVSYLRPFGASEGAT